LRVIRGYTSGFPAFDAVLDGGIKTAGRYSFTAEPGVGKTSFLLCVADRLAAQGLRVLFVSAEMSPEQIADMKSKFRLSEDVQFLYSADFDEAASLVRSGAVDVVIIDSLQTMNSVSNLRPSYQVQSGWAMEMKEMSKTFGTVFLVVNQVNHDGKMSGPKNLENQTDVPLRMDLGQNDEVIIYAPAKNRQSLKKAKRCILRKTPHGPVEIPETETGNLHRHGETLFKQGIAAVPVFFGREVTVDEITVTKA
jgi:DNA repair protein RadA/Sms